MDLLIDFYCFLFNIFWIEIFPQKVTDLTFLHVFTSLSFYRYFWTISQDIDGCRELRISFVSHFFVCSGDNLRRSPPHVSSDFHFSPFCCFFPFFFLSFSRILLFAYTLWLTFLKLNSLNKLLNQKVIDMWMTCAAS